MDTQIGLRYASVFSVLSELVDIGILVINEAGEMDFVSGRARTLLGCGEDLRLEACHQALQESIADLIGQLSPGDEEEPPAREVEFPLEGQTSHLLLEAHVIDDGDCSGALILIKDADRMRKLALDLRMSAQFRNTRRLYQAVANELKQPITAALVHIDLLKETLGANGEEKDDRPVPGAKSLRIIKEQITEFHRILNLLSEEISPAEKEERGFSLRDVIRDVGRLIEPLAALQSVTFVSHLGEHAARMSGSRQRVKQAILNLAVNALDAMPEGGNLEISLDVEGGIAAIRVKDSGIGIMPEVLPHIFEMHYTTKDSGTGAGLYVARDVIQWHGGQIEVETTSDRGTSIALTLAVSENES